MSRPNTYLGLDVPSWTYEVGSPREHIRSSSHFLFGRSLHFYIQRSAISLCIMTFQFAVASICFNSRNDFSAWPPTHQLRIYGCFLTIRVRQELLSTRNRSPIPPAKVVISLLPAPPGKRCSRSGILPAEALSSVPEVRTKALFAYSECLLPKRQRG